MKNVPAAVTLLAPGGFCSALVGPCSYAVTIDISGKHIPQVFGLMLTCGNLAATTPMLNEELFSQIDNGNLILVLFATIDFLGANCRAFMNPERADAN